MIVVLRMDLAKGWVEVARLGKSLRPWEPELQRFATAIGRLGFQELRLLDNGRNDARLRLPPGPVGTRTIMQRPEEWTHQRGHEWALEDGFPFYEGEFELEEDCLGSVSGYTALLLASYGPQEEDLMQLRLAIYEIVANVLEHGHREGRHGRLWIHLRFEAGAIRGWTQDRCQRFDPFAASTMSLPEKVLAGKKRGYGIEIMRRHLDGFGHEFNARGNRIHFEKRILR